MPLPATGIRLRQVRHSAAMDQSSRAHRTAPAASGTGAPATTEMLPLEVVLDTIEETVVVCRAVRVDGRYAGATIRYANRFARERWIGPDATADDVVGRDIYTVAPHTLELRELHERVVATGEPYTGTVRVEHRAGPRWLALHLVRLDDGFVATSRDVTDQEQAAQAFRLREERFQVELAASEERFRSALDAVGDTLAILRSIRDGSGAIVDFEIVYANRSWQEVYGEEGIDPAGQRLYERYPFFLPRRDLHIHTVETGEAIRQTLEVEGPPSAFYEFQLTRFGDGYVTASRNVTDRVTGEAALKASEERLGDVVAGIDAIVSLEDGLTGESYVSPQAERILGFPPERLADVDFWKTRVHPEDATWVFPIWDNETDEYELEYRMLAADGRTVWLRERVIHQIDRARGLDRWFGVATDVTERRTLEEQLDRARRMESLGRLASGVAHDFNNVLYGISILAGYLVRDLPDGPRREDAQQIAEAVDRGSALTRQLLTFSRGETRPAERVQLSTLVAGVRSMIGLLMGGSIGVELVGAAPGAGPSVVVDRHSLEQALVNLATNARDAMPEGGRLTLAVDAVTLDDDAAVALDVSPGEFARVIVSDTGVGVSPEVAARIFEPFATTKPVEVGTGLGLSNVYAFVRAAGGAIGFESRPGQGTAFTIHLPVAD